MRITKSHIAFAASLALSSFVMAYNDHYGPYEDGAELKRIPLEQMFEKAGVPGGKITKKGPFWFMAENAPDVCLRVLFDGEDFSEEACLYIELAKEDSILFPKTKISAFNFPHFRPYAADLNGDGTCDFIIQNYSGGCGLASSYCDVTFLLSDGNKFRSTTFMTLWPSLDYYLILGGKPCFIHTVFAGVEKCKDGKEHNFWIYNILSIEGNTLRLNNRLAPGFPKTIWFTHKHNHKETTIITDAQKAELIKRAQSEIAETLGK